MSVSELPIQMVDRYFLHLQLATSGSRDCEYAVRSSNCSRGVGHARRLMNIPTDTLIDMVCDAQKDDFEICSSTDDVQLAYYVLRM